MSHVGLISNDGIPVPLKSIDVSVAITGFIVNVEAKLIYTNDAEAPLEAVFVFPLDDQSSVYKFEALIEDREIVAEIQTKEQAHETYKEATDKGLSVALLEESDVTGDVFNCKLGNLPPKTDATLTFAFVVELPIEADGAVKFVMPTVLNPRYNPSVEDGGVVDNPSDDIPYISSSKVPYTLNFLAEIHSSDKIDRIEAGKDKIVTTTENQITKVTYADKFEFDHDITLYVYYKDSFEAQAILEKGNKDSSGILAMDVAMLNFYPKLGSEDCDNQNNEFVFIIDRSGSMQGSKIKSAREALLLFLKSLPAGCYFNVVGFGSKFESLFNKSQEYNEKNLAKAMKSQKNIDANLGGTELLGPLEHVYGSNPVSGFTRQIFVITDGDCWNVDTLLSLVRKNLHTSRVFSIGIGAGASTALVKGLARTGRGKSEFVDGKERLHGKVMRLLKCAMQTAVTEVKLQWVLPEGVSAIQIPENIPPVFDGERLIAYTIFEGEAKTGTSTVHLCGKIGDKEIKSSATINFEDSLNDSSSAPIHRLAAKAQIKELEDSEKQDGTAKKEEIIFISTAANIASKHTAFIAVDKKGKEVDGKMVPVSIPIACAVEDEHFLRECRLMASGFNGDGGDLMCLQSCGLNGGGGGGGRVIGGAAKCSLAPSRRVQKSRSFHLPSLPSLPKVSNLFRRFSVRKKKGSAPPQSVSTGALKDAAEKDDKDIGGRGPVKSASYSRPKRSSESGEDMIDLIDLQHFDGYWKLTEDLATILKISVSDLKLEGKDDNVSATAHAVAYLRKKHGSRKDEWMLIEQKALKWLEGTVGTDAETIISEVIVKF